jgi:hypothetical protein
MAASVSDRNTVSIKESIALFYFSVFYANDFVFLGFSCESLIWAQV